MSSIELSVSNEHNVHSASSIPPYVVHNSNTQLPPSAVTSNRFSSSSSYSTSLAATTIGLPRHPLQARINSYPLPQVVDTISAPSSENVATGSFPPACAQPPTSTQPNILRQTLNTVASAAPSATIFPVVNLGGGVSVQISSEPAAAGVLPLPVTAVADASEENGIIAILKYSLFLLVIGSIIAIRILA